MTCWSAPLSTPSCVAHFIWQHTLSTKSPLCIAASPFNGAAASCGVINNLSPNKLISTSLFAHRRCCWFKQSFHLEAKSGEWDIPAAPPPQPPNPASAVAVHYILAASITGHMWQEKCMCTCVWLCDTKAVWRLVTHLAAAAVAERGLGGQFPQRLTSASMTRK